MRGCRGGRAAARAQAEDWRLLSPTPPSASWCAGPLPQPPIATPVPRNAPWAGRLPIPPRASPGASDSLSPVAWLKAGVRATGSGTGAGLSSPFGTVRPSAAAGLSRGLPGSCSYLARAAAASLPAGLPPPLGHQIPGLGVQASGGRCPSSQAGGRRVAGKAALSLGWGRWLFSRPRFGCNKGAANVIYKQLGRARHCARTDRRIRQANSSRLLLPPAR